VKILVVSHAAATFEVSKGGADLLALRHASFLSKEFGEVAYVGVHHPSDPTDVSYLPVRDTDFLSYDHFGPSGASFGFLFNHFVRAIKAAMVASRECRRYRPDLIIAHTSIATVLLKTLHPRTPLVYHIHDGLFVHRTVRGRSKRVVRFLMNNLLELAAVRRADHVLCVSSSIYSQLRGAGVPTDKLTVMPFLPGRLDSGGTAPSDVSSLSAVRSLSPFILTVGQQTGRKRFDLLIEAMPFVQSPLHLVVVGDGPLGRYYADMVDRMKLTDRVHLLRQVSDVQLAQFYSNACAFFLASENEGFPITLGEAVSYGCRSILICPNIESASEYPTQLARIVREVPPPRGIAHLMDEAYRASATGLMDGGLPPSRSPIPPESPEGARVVRSNYDRVFHRLLGPRDAVGVSTAAR
jgi:glycosyltransferase involved in cell wall biosynthesis